MISKYILKEHIGPLFLALFILTFILLMNRIFRMIDLIISKGLAVTTVLKLFLLTLPFLLAMTIPMATLVAVVLAFGRLSGDNEIMAFKASGVNLFRLVVPVLLGASLITVGMIYFNDVILPETNHEFKNLMIAIHRKHPTLSIEERVFINDFDGYQIYITEKDDQTSTIYGVIIHEIGSNMRIARTILAASGTLKVDPNNTALLIDLKDGEIHEIDPQDQRKYRLMHFKNHRLNLQLESELDEDITSSRGDRELNIQAMQDKIASYRTDKIKVRQRIKRLEELLAQSQADSIAQADSMGAASDSVVISSGPDPSVLTPSNPYQALETQIVQQHARLESLDRYISKYQVEIHKKYALPVACIVFVLIGAPMGVVGRRGFGVLFSFFAFVFYYICLIGGEELADRRLISPFFAMWTANVVLGGLGFFLLFYSNYERIRINAEWFLRFIPAKWRQKLRKMLKSSLDENQ